MEFRLSCADLLAQAARLARAIRDTSGAPAGPVALLLPAGATYIAAWFACMAAGRPMLMVELANPPARNAALLEAAGCALVLHDGAPEARAAMGARAGLMPPPVPAPGPPEGLESALESDEPAFLFATSGSSGAPKLVAYSQACLQAKLQCSVRVMGIRPGDVAMIAGTHANFGVMHHALTVLCSGATLCLHDMGTGGLAAMFDAVRAHGVTQMRFTPSLFRTVAALPAAAAALRQITAVRFSGEPLLRGDAELARFHCAPGCLVQILYGSTESMIFFWQAPEGELPAGEVMPNGFIYPVAEFLVLDDAGQAVAPGEAGELVISSLFHALGDWRVNAPEDERVNLLGDERVNALGDERVNAPGDAPGYVLGDWGGGGVDASRFPPDPRGGGRRLYHTGDLVRLLPDGAMILLGRKDRLVKINGQRVALLEVEAALGRMPGCAQAAALAWAREAGTQLVAFLVPQAGMELPDNPGAWLAAQLPRYMVPARFEILAELPLLPGGKVDGQALLARLAALPAPPAPAASAAPADELTATLTELWVETLRIPPPRQNVDFFALGGYFLKAIVLLAALEKRLGERLRPGLLVQFPTIESLANAIRRGQHVERKAQSLLPAPRPDMRDALQLRLVRPARGTSRGVALGMPNFYGWAAQNGVIAAHALQDYDVWTFATELGAEERTMLQDNTWLTCARAIADHILATDWLKPCALFGYSVGGYIAWTVDRFLMGAGWAPTPLINFDSGPMHQEKAGLLAEIDALLPAGAALQPVRMLLLNRTRPGRFTLFNETAERWTAAGVATSVLSFNTVSHHDLALGVAIAAADEAMSAFAATGQVGPALSAGADEFDTLGGELFRLLRGDEAPDAATARRLVARNPLPVDNTCLVAQLFLLIMAGEADLALAYARLVTASRPKHRPATYAQVALLKLLGYPNKAADVAASWCARQKEDRAMQALARRLPDPGAALGGGGGGRDGLQRVDRLCRRVPGGAPAGLAPKAALASEAP